MPLGHQRGALRAVTANASLHKGRDPAAAVTSLSCMRKARSLILVRWYPSAICGQTTGPTTSAVSI